jgi:hypothetical protein
MRIFSIFLILILTNQITYSQTKKKTVTAKPEIDQLYSKYKDSDQIILYTAFGELIGNVTCNLNVDNKPESIEILIETENREAAARFIADLIQQKLKNKYREGNATYNSTWEFESIKFQLDISNQFEDMRQPFYFTKNTMFTKIEYSCLNCDENNDFETKNYKISITTGDKSRSGGKNATKFEF